MDSSISPRTKPLFRTIQAIWYVFGFIEVLLAFRFALKLLGANPDAGFTALVYSFSYPFVAPFINVFNVAVTYTSVFEWTTLLAMFVYWLIGLGIVKLLMMSKPMSTPEAAVRLEEEV